MIAANKKLEAGIELPVMETFYTIQGEGAFTGHASFFIRLGGCDVGCSWCDVKESWDMEAHPQRSVESLVSEALQHPARIAVITGGEPLLQQRALAKALADGANQLKHGGTAAHGLLQGHVAANFLAPEPQLQACEPALVAQLERPDLAGLGLDHDLRPDVGPRVIAGEHGPGAGHGGEQRVVDDRDVRDRSVGAERLRPAQPKPVAVGDGVERRLPLAGPAAGRVVSPVVYVCRGVVVGFSGCPPPSGGGGGDDPGAQLTGRTGAVRSFLGQRRVVRPELWCCL